MKKLFLISTLIVATTILTSFLPSEKSLNEIKKEDPIAVKPQVVVEEPIVQEEPKAVESIKTETTDDKIKRSFFDKYIDKIKEFLDNAE